MSEPLKPCPFCGQNGAWAVGEPSGDGWVTCDTCDAVGPLTLNSGCAGAITLWNKRSDTALWTSIHEGLPDTYDVVIVSHSGGVCEGHRVVSRTDHPGEVEWRSPRMSSGNDALDVTHWRRFPQPPTTDAQPWAATDEPS